MIRDSRGISIDFQPWFNKGFGLSMLRISESLGGELANGEIVLFHNGSKSVFDTYEKENYGTIRIEREDVAVYEIPVTIYSKSMDWNENYIKLSFFCGFSDLKFISENSTSDWPNIQSAITGLYPGKTNITCDPDIPDNKVYQCNESGVGFLKELCYAYKRNSVFGFGWSGLILKETYDRDDQEKKGLLVSNTSVVQLDQSCKTYNPTLYKPPQTIFETKNLSVTKISDRLQVSHKDYSLMQSNAAYNKLYMDSEMFQSFRVVDSEIPKHKLGQVIKYRRADSMKPDSIADPLELYLVKSNELFLTGPNSRYTDEDGKDFSWTTHLLGIEEAKDGTVSISLGKTEDPYE